MILVLKILFRVVGYGLVIAAIWYTPYRLSRLLGLRRSWPLCTVTAIFVIMAIAGMMSLNASPNAMVGGIVTVAGLLFGLFIYLTFLLPVLDLLKRWIGLPDRTTAWVAVSLALLISVIGTWRANDFAVTEIEIPIAELKQDVTLMHIPDMHIGHHRSRTYLEKIVDETNQRNPDLVLLNGDLVDSNAALAPGVMSAIARFEAPVFITTGNHEYYVDTNRALEIFAQYGGRILHNEVVETHGLQLVGLDYMNADENAFDLHAVNKMTIKEELPKIPFSKDMPVILMHHSPVGLEYVSAWGVSLMLSGHTHAGQIFPATLITPFLFPLNKGLHKHNGTFFFVSQGAGTYGPRMRLGSSNEINLIRLKVKQ